MKKCWFLCSKMMKCRMESIIINGAVNLTSYSISNAQSDQKDLYHSLSVEEATSVKGAFPVGRQDESRCYPTTLIKSVSRKS